MIVMDEELIRKVAEVVMGWTWTITSQLGGPDYWSSESSIGDATTDFNPLTNLNHAFMVVERMRELGWDCGMWTEGMDDWRVLFVKSINKVYRPDAVNMSLGHAICMAALKAVENG